MLDRHVQMVHAELRDRAIHAARHSLTELTRDLRRVEDAKSGDSYVLTGCGLERTLRGMTYRASRRVDQLTLPYDSYTTKAIERGLSREQVAVVPGNYWVPLTLVSRSGFERFDETIQFRTNTGRVHFIWRPFVEGTMDASEVQHMVRLVRRIRRRIQERRDSFLTQAQREYRALEKAGEGLRTRLEAFGLDSEASGGHLLFSHASVHRLLEILDSPGVRALRGSS